MLQLGAERSILKLIEEIECHRDRDLANWVSLTTVAEETTQRFSIYR